MELPVKIPQSYQIRTINLSYKLPSNWLGWEGKMSDDTKFILKNVSCEANSGELTAIAGPSGAGKTTLLEVLAGMIVPRRISGRVLVNNLPMDVTYFRRVSGYVTQDEALFPLLTVEETFMYSARLRLHGGHETAKIRVAMLLKELGLDHIAGVRIGSESNRGVSGGEKRRVAIGVDLVHDPAVVLLDEPTSGLDSASALHVMTLLKSMSKNQGKTIVLTIHQPGFRILDLIDRVVLLSNGVSLHNGTLSLLEDRLQSKGHYIPRHVNVLEFAIDVIDHLHEDETDSEKRGDEKECDHIIENSNHDIYCNSAIEEVWILSHRFFNNIIRTKQLFVVRTAQALLAGVVLGTIFMNAFSNSKRLKLQDQLGFFAFTLTFLMSSTTEALPIFLQERIILMRETTRGAYRVSSYIIANTLIFLPFLLTVAVLYATSVYWLVGMRHEIDGFVYFTLVVWMVVLMSNSFVVCLSALVPNFITGMSLIAGIMGSFFLFSGYFISKDTIPKYWKFMEHLSLFKYPFECFMINEFGGEQGKSRCLESIDGICAIFGEQFLEKQGLKESQKWSNLVMTLIFVITYRFAAFLILRYRTCIGRS